MTESFGALCSAWYVNLKLALKLDLPRKREEVLDLFERIRRQFPAMSQFRRYREELALESEPEAEPQRWVALRGHTIRAGVVDPDRFEDAYALHRCVLEVAPYYLSISPLDVDYVELLYGFDLNAGGNHDEIVFEALVAGSPLAAALDIPGSHVVDCQPMFGVALNDVGSAEAFVEVTTRPPERGEYGTDRPPEPISVLLTLRRYGPVGEIAELPSVLDELSRRGEQLVHSRVVPNLVVPIRVRAGAGG